MSASPTFHRIGPVVAALALWASSQTAALAGASSICDMNGSSNVASTFTGAIVCGQIQGSGVTYGSSFGPNYLPATFTVSGAPIQSGLTPVGLSGVVAGTGVFGGVDASGYFGQAHISASAQDTNPHNAVDTSQVSTQGNVGFGDSFTVGSANVEARVTVGADGSFAGAGAGQLKFNLFDITPYQSGTLAGLNLGLNPGSTNVSQTYDLTFLSGHTYEFYFEMEADAFAAESFLYNEAEGLADMSHTGTLNIDVETPGQSLTFFSGHDYSTDAVVTPPTGPTTPVGPGGSTVPEPSAVSLFFVGLAGLVLIARRRSSRAGSGSSCRSQRLTEGFGSAPSLGMA